MKSYFGTYTEPGMQAVECTVLVFERNLSIGYKGAGGVNRSVNWMLRELTARFEPARGVSQIRHNKLPGELSIEGRESAEYLLSQQALLKLPWYRKSSGREWIRNSILLLGIIGILILLYMLIVPWLSQKLAARVPVKTEQQLGDAVYSAMGLEEQKDSVTSGLLNEFFAAMEVNGPYQIRISVVEDDVVNAFALPGGRIVVYSALLKQIGSYPELAALLSHEYIHIREKHTTKSIFRRLGSRVFLSLLFGKFGTVTSILVDHADNLKQLTYSRSLEKEADMKGLDILMQRQIDPRGFTELFEHLEASSPGPVMPEFLASHPDIQKRIRNIKEASKNAPVSENARLKAIFEQLNQ
ncbi:MAG: M48 family metallopeptidase [Chitinophagaceae bacterium]